MREPADEMGFVQCDRDVCDRYAGLRATVASLGKPIPENDVWVAACASATAAALVTRDTPLEHIPHLTCEEW